MENQTRLSEAWNKAHGKLRRKFNFRFLNIVIDLMAVSILFGGFYLIFKNFLILN